MTNLVLRRNRFEDWKPKSWMFGHGWCAFTKEELSKHKDCIMKQKQPLKFPNGHKPKPESQEDIEREKSQVGFGVQRMDGFVGSRRK